MNNDFAIVIPNCITGIIVVIIALASLREIIAMTGIVKPEHKYSWLVYGKYDQNIIIRALCNLGYSKEESERFEKDFRKRASRIEVSINEENAPIYLVILLSAYIMKFDKKIQYGGNTLSNSNYYINTMEMTHNQENLKWLTEIMICLLNKKGEFTTKPDVFIAPKGGNPLFSQSVARRYDRQLILAKSKEDKSRVISDDIYERFSANFEGSWNIINEKKEKTCIVYDCNTSGGSQLLSIVKEINELNNNTEVKLTPPSLRDNPVFGEKQTSKGKRKKF